MKKLGVFKGVPEGVSVALGGWEEPHGRLKPRERVRNRREYGGAGN